MRVLVGHASDHGSTSRGIAERIATRLTAKDTEVVCLPVDASVEVGSPRVEGVRTAGRDLQTVAVWLRGRHRSGGVT